MARIPTELFALIKEFTPNKHIVKLEYEIKQVLLAPHDQLEIPRYTDFPAYGFGLMLDRWSWVEFKMDRAFVHPGLFRRIVGLELERSGEKQDFPPEVLYKLGDNAAPLSGLDQTAPLDVYVSNIACAIYHTQTFTRFLLWGLGWCNDGSD